jgi:hypothetical protein
LEKEEMQKRLQEAKAEKERIKSIKKIAEEAVKKKEMLYLEGYAFLHTHYGKLLENEEFKKWISSENSMNMLQHLVQNVSETETLRNLLQKFELWESYSKQMRDDPDLEKKLSTFRKFLKVQKRARCDALFGKKDEEYEEERPDIKKRKT